MKFHIISIHIKKELEQWVLENGIVASYPITQYRNQLVIREMPDKGPDKMLIQNSGITFHSVGALSSKMWYIC